MSDYIEFPHFITKGIEVNGKNFETGDERRVFKGHITAEIIDKQHEFVFVKEVMKIMETFMSVNPVISDYHSNRMVGKVLAYEQSEYQGVPTVLITGELYKKDGVTLYDKVWDKVVKGEYAGLSMGGASKEREPIQKDGKMALELRKLELYEIALCDTPANPFAIIESVNTFAKAQGLEEMVKDYNGREQIRCNSLSCKFEKGTDLNQDKDLDHNYRCDDDSNICVVCGVKKTEHGIEQFDKPTEKLDSKTLVNRSAETRADNVGESTGSPKQVNDLMSQIPKQTARPQVKPIPLKQPDKPKGLQKDHIPATPESIEGKARKKNKDLEKQQVPHGKPEKLDKEKWDVHKMINHFGINIVKKALEEAETLEYLKKLSRKYSI